ncbi:MULTISPECIES: hypothetical protein [Paenibacillus]|uniref:hypothetical protein n=1 Tax=Paenibacillus TaxID=44249 RepID=UPI0022B935C2|nr:hypothetical protein [Paenibacillus caseinilyticus]MCZ8519810.1 hypothetical protein [Paenibacillus caseinilyticus]
MTTDQTTQLDRITSLYEQASAEIRTYWFAYSHMGTWQFWMELAMLVLPLIVLFLYIDREQALLLGLLWLQRAFVVQLY